MSFIHETSPHSVGPLAAVVGFTALLGIASPTSARANAPQRSAGQRVVQVPQAQEGIRAEMAKGEYKVTLAVTESGDLVLLKEKLEVETEPQTRTTQGRLLWKQERYWSPWDQYNQLRWIESPNGSLTVITPRTDEGYILRVWALPNYGPSVSRRSLTVLANRKIISLCTVDGTGSKSQDSADKETALDEARPHPIVDGLGYADLFLFHDQAQMVIAGQGQRPETRIYVAQLNPSLSPEDELQGSFVAKGETPRAVTMDGKVLVAMRRPTRLQRRDHAPARLAFCWSEDLKTWSEDPNLATTDDLLVGEDYELVFQGGELFLASPHLDGPNEGSVEIFRRDPSGGGWELLSRVRVTRRPGEAWSHRFLGFGGPDVLGRPGLVIRAGETTLLHL